MLAREFDGASSHAVARGRGIDAIAHTARTTRPRLAYSEPQPAKWELIVATSLPNLRPLPVAPAPEWRKYSLRVLQDLDHASTKKIVIDKVDLIGVCEF